MGLDERTSLDQGSCDFEEVSNDMQFRWWTGAASDGG